MSELTAVVAAKIRDEDVSLERLLNVLKINGQIGAFLTSAINDVLVSQAAARHELSASDEDLQQAADRFRQQNGLEKASDTHEWIKQNDLSVDDFEARLERAIVLDKLKKQVTADQVEPFFAEHRTAYDHAVLSHVVVEDEGVASELLSQIQEGESELGDLAGKHSVDEHTKENGGQLGLVNRKTLSPAVESAVFSAQAGDVVGPIKTDMGYHIIQVEELHLGELNDVIAATIREQLFANWLAEEYTNANVQLTLNQSL